MRADPSRSCWFLMILFTVEMPVLWGLASSCSASSLLQSHSYTVPDLSAGGLLPPHQCLPCNQHIRELVLRSRAWLRHAARHLTGRSSQL